MKRPGEIGFDDLHAIEDGLAGYEEYRRLRGLPPSDQWRKRTLNGLKKMGFVNPLTRGTTPRQQRAS